LIPHPPRQDLSSHSPPRGGGRRGPQTPSGVRRGGIRRAPARHSSRERDAVLMAVLAATDVYVWKLLRRDLGLDPKQAQAAIERLVTGALIDN
jgi:hypothetical protein